MFSWAIGRKNFVGTQNEFELAMVNDPQLAFFINLGVQAIEVRLYSTICKLTKKAQITLCGKGSHAMCK